VKSARRIWTLQLLWAFLGGLPFLLLPRLILGLTTGRPAAELPTLEVDWVRMVGAASMGLSLFTALGLTRQVFAWQRSMAAIFLVFLTMWSAILLFDQATGAYARFVPWLTVAPALVLALANLLILVQRGTASPPETQWVGAPTRLRWLWALQGLFYLGEAAVFLVAARSVLSWMTGLPEDDVRLTPIACQQVRIVAAWTVTLGLASLHASLDHRIRDWRQYRWPFFIALLVRVAALAANESSGTVGPGPTLTLAAPGIAFAFLGFAWTFGALARATRALRAQKVDAPAAAGSDAAVIWLWLVQLALLLVSGLAGVLAPRVVLGWLTPLGPVSEYAADGMRLAGSLQLALAGFTVYALMLSGTAFRRRFAVAFCLAFTISAMLLWFAFAADVYSGTMAFYVSLQTLLALLNLRWALATPPGARPEDDAGIAGQKPTCSFLAWLGQAVLLTGGGLVLVFATEAVLAALTGGMAARGVSPPLHRLTIHQWQIVGVLAVAVAALTGVALTSERDREWRGFAFFSSLSFVLFSIVLSLLLLTARYESAAGLAWVAGLAIVAVNAWIRRRRDPWAPADSPHTMDHWTLFDLVAGPLMGLSVLLTKRRSSHLLGVGARGRFRVSSGVRDGAPGHPLPSNDFFVPERELPVVVRFANLTELDDASLDVRGCSIKFSDQAFASPFDLLMNTGSYCPAYNLPSFASFVLSKFLPAKVSRFVLQRNLIAREGGVAGLRRAPDSYVHLRYHSQIVRHWVDRDGVRHLVRYRCVPDDDVRESGLPSPADAAHMWERGRLPDERRARDYLRQELYERVARSGASLHLEAQFHVPAPGDGGEWYNAAVDWDEAACPWLEIGRLTLDEPLSPVDTELLQFDPGHHPLTLGIPRSGSLFDYRSMGDSEVRVVRALQRLRLWMYATFGLPSLAPLGRGREAAP
jgi:arachidonate 5-lipoxygenase